MRRRLVHWTNNHARYHIIQRVVVIADLAHASASGHGTEHELQVDMEGIRDRLIDLVADIENVLPKHLLELDDTEVSERWPTLI